MAHSLSFLPHIWHHKGGASRWRFGRLLKYVYLSAIGGLVIFTFSLTPACAEMAGGCEGPVPDGRCPEGTAPENHADNPEHGDVCRKLANDCHADDCHFRCPGGCVGPLSRPPFCATHALGPCRLLSPPPPPTPPQPPTAAATTQAGLPSARVDAPQPKDELLSPALAPPPPPTPPQPPTAAATTQAGLPSARVDAPQPKDELLSPALAAASAAGSVCPPAMSLERHIGTASHGQPSRLIDASMTCPRHVP